MEVKGKLRWSDMEELFGREIWQWEKLFDLSDLENEIDKVIKKKLLETLRVNDFSQKQTAGELRISFRQLNYMVKKYHINHPSWRRRN